MPISKKNAESAIKALSASGTGEMFERIRGNQHSMEKHFSKQTAYEHAQLSGYPQGYFKRIQMRVFTSVDDRNQTGLQPKTWQRAMDFVGAKKQRDFGRKLGSKGGEISIPEKSAASKDNILDLVGAVIDSQACELRQNNDHLDTRFIAVAPMPAGFYGRSIDDQGVKGKDCDYAVVVVNAASTSNPQIVTIFPANANYVGGRPLLV